VEIKCQLDATEEQELLDLGTQYSIQQLFRKYWTNLIVETERAIRLLDAKIQDTFRLMAAKKLKLIHSTHQNISHTHKRGNNTLQKTYNTKSLRTMFL